METSLTRILQDWELKCCNCSMVQKFSYVKGAVLRENVLRLRLMFTVKMGEFKFSQFNMAPSQGLVLHLSMPCVCWDDNHDVNDHMVQAAAVLKS